MIRNTNYYNAVHYLHSSLVLCNNLPEVDPSVYDNFRFELDDDRDIFQWFITDCTENDVEWLEKSFGLLFTYSDALDVYVLCVDHYGTMWDGVHCDCFNDDIPDALLERTSRDF